MGKIKPHARGARRFNLKGLQEERALAAARAGGRPQEYVAQRWRALLLHPINGARLMPASGM
jgi:hypothetical protein